MLGGDSEAEVPVTDVKNGKTWGVAQFMEGFGWPSLKNIQRGANSEAED